MYTLKTKCLYCDFEGVLEILNEPHDYPESMIFRHLGHNAVSGHIHYQCPACDIILLVDPMDILTDEFIANIRYEPQTMGFLPSLLPSSPMH